MVDPPSRDAPQQVTRILRAVPAGEPEASAARLPLVYGDLRKLAAARRARLGPGQTLQATALVHEAYVRLVEEVLQAFEREWRFAKAWLNGQLAEQEIGK